MVIGGLRRNPRGLGAHQSKPCSNFSRRATLTGECQLTSIATWPTVVTEYRRLGHYNCKRGEMDRWRNIEQSSAGRPALSENEVILFVQNSVGLYDGYTPQHSGSYDRKFKSPNHQDGTVYLTSHRVCYVDEFKPMLYSIGSDLEQIDKIETSVPPSGDKG